MPKRATVVPLLFRRAVILSLLLSGPALAPPTFAALSLEQIMQDPDWIGPPVEEAWWQFDGSGYHYRAKRAGEIIRDTWAVDADGTISRVDAPMLANSDAADPVINANGTLALSARGGSLLLRDLANGELTQLFSGAADVTSVAFSSDGSAAHFHSGGRWWRVALTGEPAIPMAELRFEESPHGKSDDQLKIDQLRLFSTLERERAQEEAAHDEQLADAQAAPSLVAPPWYLGDGIAGVASALSADGPLAAASGTEAR